MARGPIISWEIGEETAETVSDFIFSSVQFSCSLVSDSLRPHELQQARPPCPSPTPRVHSDLCTEYIMRSAGLEETQAGMKIAGRNINHLRYADDTTLMAERE